MSAERDADVVVVGAGIAGLVAARRVTEQGASVMVVEARDRVGGRTVNADIGDGGICELGGQWVGPTQDAVLALIAELGLETFPTNTEGENTLDFRGRTRRYSGLVPRMNPLVLADVEQARRGIDRLAARVPLDAPWEAPNAPKLDSVSLAAWLDRRMRTRAARGLIDIALRTVWGAAPNELSLLHALFYVHSGGSLYSLLDTEGGAQQDRVAGGSQLISTRIADALGDRVAAGAPVRRIEHGADGVRVHTGPAAAEPTLTVRARQAIVSAPSNMARRIAFEPALPAELDQAWQRIAFGRLRKVAAVYDEPFWRADGLSGEAVTDAGPVTLTFDNSPPGGRPGVLLGFIGGPEEAEAARLTPDERRTAVLGCFERLFGARAARPESFLELSWSEEEWSRGGPAGLLQPGAWTGFGRALREPVGPLHWAGAETSPRWCGYMDGAVRSGEAAAAAALSAL